MARVSRHVRRVDLLVELKRKLAGYPLVYYFVGYMGRYRMPLNWLFFLLAGAAVWHWIVKARAAAVRAPATEGS